MTDCAVTMTDCDYQAPPRKWPGTTLSDYRDLTPLVLMAALADGGTAVCEPVLAFHLEVPADVIGPMVVLLQEVGARPGSPATRASVCTIEGEIPVAQLHALQVRLPDLTRGEGVLETHHAGYRPVTGPPPTRPHRGRDPRDRSSYLRGVAGP